MASTYTAIASTTLTNSASTITFNSIPSTYTELFLSVHGKYSVYATTGIQFNGSSSGYGYLRQLGYVSTNLGFYNDHPASYAGTGVWDNEWSALEIWIPGYKDTNNRKTFIAKGYLRAIDVTLNVGTWTTTSAINSITLTGNATYQAGTTATLFGVLA